MSSYPAAGRRVSVSADGGDLPAGVMVAVRLADLVTPLRDGAMVTAGGRSALVVAGTPVIRTGDAVVFCKVVLVTEAVVKKAGQVRAEGSPCAHATLGPLEDWLDAQAGPGTIARIAEAAALDARFVTGERERLLTTAFMIRVIVLMTLVPQARVSGAAAMLAGDLALVPWRRRWNVPSERACRDWRKALGPRPLEELRAAVLGAARDEHRDGPPPLTVGWKEPLVPKSLDGTLIRVPDTPANRAAFGTVGTADGSSAWPCIRALPMSDCCTRSVLAMPWGPAGTSKTASEQGLLDMAIFRHAHIFGKDQVWLMDRLWHGVRRIKALAGLTHVLIRVKSDIVLKRTSKILPDGSYRAQVSGDGVTMTVRVIEYLADVEGQHVPEMFCLITDLLDCEEHPAIELARLYKWRWDGSETGIREGKATLHGAGPGTGAMLRSGSPALVAQEIAAWACGTEMTRGVTRDAARAAAPARKGRRAGQPVELPRPVPDRIPPPVPRRDPHRKRPLRHADRQDRGTPHRHRPGPAPRPQVQVPQHLRPRRPGGHGHPHRSRRHHPRQQARRLTSTDAGTQPPKPPRTPQTPPPDRGNRPVTGTARRPASCPESENYAK